MTTAQTPAIEALAEQLVDAMAATPGAHAGLRPCHAKGLVCRGTFTGGPGCRTLCRAAHFSGAMVQAIIRFSDGSGDPNAHDGQPNVRGMAVKFHLSDHAATDIVAISVEGFAARTGEAFLEFVRARAIDPATGLSSPSRVDAFLTSHPAAKAFVGRVLSRPAPVSYAQSFYYATHAFKFMSADGVGRFGQYRWRPEAGEKYFAIHPASNQEPDFLRKELETRLAEGPASFVLEAQMANPDDPLDDVTAIWPEGRQIIELGRLEVTEISPTGEEDERSLSFDPSKLTDGIEPPVDPLFAPRARAYAISFARRTAQGRIPEA